MTPVETIAALAKGDPAAAQGLLPAARAHAFGAEAFGPAAIVKLFGRPGRPLSPDPAVLVGPRTLSVFDADLEGAEQAWVADLYDGRIGRLWRIGDGDDDPTAEPMAAFAMDPFLSQDRDPVALRPQDHPDLALEATPALVLAALEALGPDAEASAGPGRAFVLRALSVADRGAALLTVIGAGDGPARLVAVAFRFDAGALTHLRTVWDAPRSTPRLQRLVMSEL